MIVVITMCYLAVVMLAFKVIKIKVTANSVAAASFIGVVLLTGVVIVWNMSAPMTGQITLKRSVIPLMSGQDSREMITKLHVPQEQMVKKGDILYEVDRRPSQYAADKLTSQLAVSQQTILELEAAVAVAEAGREAAEAGAAYAQAEFNTSKKTQELNPNAIAKLQVTVQEQKFEASKAAVEQTIAQQQQAEFALTSAKEAIKSTRAQLNTAELNLEQCVIRAPADGYIMSWQAVEGTMTTTLMSSAQGTFMDLSETWVGAVFPQNLLKNVQAGDTVEIAFKSLPGQIATGKVDAVLEYTGEGQAEPSGELIRASTVGSKGYLVVRIDLDDAKLARELPLGGAGTVAIYTKVGRPFQIISKIALRIKAWIYYAPV